MKRVKIISGTYGYRENGKFSPKDRNSEPFEINDKEAARLVGMGVASYVDDTAIATPENGDFSSNASVNTNGIENSTEGDSVGVPQYSSESPVSTLREIAKSVGISFKVGTTKEEMVAALDEYFSTDDNDDDEPSLSVDDPIE